MEKAIVELLARRAGLDKALAEFPEDVVAARRAGERCCGKDESSDRSAR
jgi:hypothetical protein